MKKKLLTSALSLLLLAGVAQAKQPIRMFLVGDAMMANVENLDESAQRGWGQVLPTYLTSGVQVDNRAEAQESVQSLLTSGRWESLLGELKRNDIVMIQLGRLDIDETNPMFYLPLSEFEVKLMQLVTDAQKKNARVILLTQVANHYWKEGEFRYRLGAYPEGVRRVAKRTGVPMVDIEQLTSDMQQELGEEASAVYYVEGGEALTEQGALEVGELVMRGLQEQGVKWMKKLIHLADGQEVLYVQPKE